MKNGVPFNVAFSLDTRYAQAMSIAFSTFAGGKFDFETWGWVKD